MYLKKPTLLVILDGFGHSPSLEYNAIAQAKKPTIDDLLAHYPHTLLAASGKAVGLPPGVIGNSEVGHTTLGAGRVLPSPFLQLHESIASGAFFTNPILDKNLNELAQTDSTLHIIGLLSDAGVQSHQEIIYALLHAAMQHKIKKIVIHAIVDRAVCRQNLLLCILSNLKHIFVHTKIFLWAQLVVVIIQWIAIIIGIALNWHIRCLQLRKNRVLPTGNKPFILL